MTFDKFDKLCDIKPQNMNSPSLNIGKQQTTYLPCFLEGCPILRQIYAWHCIVFTSPNNTVQKHNNKE